MEQKLKRKQDLGLPEEFRLSEAFKFVKQSTYNNRSRTN